MLASCSSDDVTKTEEITAPTYSAFKAQVENKIWTPDTEEEVTWITTDGKVLTAEDLEPASGNSYRYSYFFSGDEATRFVFCTFGPVSGPRAYRVDYGYTYDPQTGHITFDNSDDVKANVQDIDVEIESVTETRMIIRDQYGCERAPDCAYRRVVYKAVENEQAADFWSTYVLL